MQDFEGICDPTFYLCADTNPPPLDSLVVWLNSDNNEGFSLLNNINVSRNPSVKIDGDYSSIKPYFGDINKWMDLRTRQNKVGPAISKISREINPTERIINYSGLRWIGRAGLKLANIDAIFKVSRSDSTFREPIDIRGFEFADLAGGPGAFTQYLQYRRPRSVGYGMSLETQKKGCAWELSQLDTSRFNVLRGADNSGDLIKNYYWTIDEIKKKRADGLDLVVSDGFIKEDESISFEDYLNEEIINVNLVICELGIGLNILKEEGDLVCKVTDTLRPIMAEVLFCLTVAFEKVCLFKPITSRLANAEKYIVCKSRRKDITKVLKVFATYYDQILNGYIASPVMINVADLEGKEELSLPKEFVQRLIKSNNFFINSQIIQLQKIEDRHNGKRVVIRNLNLPRVYDLWHIPMRGDRYTPRSNLAPCK